MPDQRLSVQPPFFPLPKTDWGRVSLVGAGPGDPGLITVRGVELLGKADVVLYDALANERLLSHAPQAEWVSVGKHGSGLLWTQDEINRQLVACAQAGKHVVRLKGGDPAIFARTGDELDYLVEQGISFEVVPGITAALAAASYVGIPLTHRQHASAVAFVTGQQQDENPQPIDWNSLANFPGTLVFYMGVTSAPYWTENLLRSGMSPDVPAALVRRCTWPDQLTIRCTLGEVPGKLTGLRPPIIVIVGAVCGLGDQFDWFTKRSLSGVGVLVTRPVAQASNLATQLRELGADVYCQPILEIEPLADFSSVDRYIDKLARHSYAGVSFSSVNGVEAFFSRVNQLGWDARILAGCKVAVVGSKTGERLLQFGVRADVVPSQFGAIGLIQQLGTSVNGENWLAILADQSQPALIEGLTANGAHVDGGVFYHSRPATNLNVDIRAALERNRIQWITITSPLMATSAHALFGQYLPALTPISFSSAISTELKRLGWPPAIETQQPTDESLVAALVRRVSAKR